MHREEVNVLAVVGQCYYQLVCVAAGLGGRDLCIGERRGRSGWCELELCREATRVSGNLQKVNFTFFIASVPGYVIQATAAELRTCFINHVFVRVLKKLHPSIGIGGVGEYNSVLEHPTDCAAVAKSLEVEEVGEGLACG